MMTILRILVWIVSLALIGGTLLPLWRSAHWWVRVWEYPRFQIAAMLLLAIAAQLFLLWPLNGAEIVLIAASLGCLGWQAYRIFPYTPLHKVQTLAAEAEGDENTISFVIANVLQKNRTAKPLLEQIAALDPDIVLCVETDQWWDEQLRPFGKTRPHSVRHPQDDTYGMILYSRLELSDTRLQERVDPDIPSIFTRVRLRSGQLVNLHCLHPRPPRPSNDVEERDSEILLVGFEIRKNDQPTIVAGDLNDVGWSHTTKLFQRVSGLLDPRVGRGLFASFHAEYRWARWPLDHVFHGQSFRLLDFRILRKIGSDHFPVYVALVHDASAKRDHAIPDLEHGDRQEARRKIRKGGEEPPPAAKA